MANATIPPDSVAPLLDVRAVAQLLGCSTRHVYRLADDGRMPAPVRVGALVRWQRQTILEWVASGCKPVPGIEGHGHAGEPPPAVAIGCGGGAAQAVTAKAR